MSVRPARPAARQAEEIRVPGLLPGDTARIRAALGREPSVTEWRLFGVLWSEHCAYRHSKPLLRTLPSEGPHVVQGPGENAGIVDLGEGLGLALKAESHNHPSAVEPYEGAATGVGGILRDILALGARPVALMDGLCFGPQDLPRARYLRRGIVAGVGGYGNAVGVPTVGGFVRVHPAYADNPLVNVLAAGLVPLDRIVLGRASQVGDLVVLVGAGTGRDGVGGASFASERLGDDTAADRPMVQVGDPFAEKRLIEAALEMLSAGWVHASQDMGAAGIASSTSELAFRGGTGMELELERVPLRQEGLMAWEILLSESQERMAFTCAPADFERIAAVAERYALYAAVIGRITDTGRYVVRMHGEVVADLPLALLADAPPVSLPEPEAEHVFAPAAGQARASAGHDVPPALSAYALRRLLAEVLTDPNVAPKRAIYETYDAQVGGRTSLGPPSGCAVLALDDREDAVALTFDANPHHGERDPYAAAALTVAEAVQNLAAVGAEPLGLTNCVNLGDPETREGAASLRATLRGLNDAARALGVPIVSGNVSLYNQGSRGSIPPTLAVGMVGHILAYRERLAASFAQPGDLLYLVGDTAGQWSASVAARLLGPQEGSTVWSQAAPHTLPFDATRLRSAVELVREGVRRSLVQFAADIWAGGLAAVLLRHLGVEARGAALRLPPPEDDSGPVGWAARLLLGEGPGRFLVAVSQERADAWHTFTHGASAKVTALGRLTDTPRLVVHVVWDGEEHTMLEADLRPLMRDMARVWEAAPQRTAPADPAAGTAPLARALPHDTRREVGTL